MGMFKPSAALLFTVLCAGAVLGQAPAPTTLRVPVGKSLVVESPDPLRRVSVTDPDIASAIVVSERQVLIHGLIPGAVTLLLWDEQDRAQAYDLLVEFKLNEIRVLLGQMFPEEEIEVRQLGASLLLKGVVSSEAVVEQAVALAKTYSAEVVNMLGEVQNNQVVMLQVRFAEVNRAAVQELGLNIFSTGGANTMGNISTQQFQGTLGNIGSVPPEVERGRDPDAPSLVGGGVGNPLKGSPGVFGLTDLLNLFVFRPDINVGFTLRALQQQNLLQILAEPNVLALNGKEASFLAGGEFPFPVVQGGTNFTAVTIVFKEFGVRLKFTPELQGNGHIRLKVEPEVSALDFSNALTISGFLVPAISTRRASTEVELLDGQSFAIAGLIDDRLIEVYSKIPLLGDIPFFGKLFRSRSINKNNTELLVVVTPKLVSPTGSGTPLEMPAFPKDFMDPTRFDDNFENKKVDPAPPEKNNP